MKTSSNIQRSNYNTESDMLEYVFAQKMMHINTNMVCIFDSYITQGDAKYAQVTQFIDNIDSTGKPLASPMQFDVPIMYVMGGNAGINVTYKKGDLLLVAYSQRTLADLKIAWNQGQDPTNPVQPSNYGKFTLEDGIIVGKISRKIPDVIIDINDDGITINSNNKAIEINSGTADTSLTCNNATVSASGDINASCTNANITATANVEVDCVSATINATASMQITTPTLTLNGNLVVNGIVTSTDAVIGGVEFITHTHTGGTIPPGNTGPVII